MANFCPQCGYELIGEFKFCPNCGEKLSVELNNSESKTETYKADEIVEKSFVICENCGDENPVENKICNTCGAPLKGERVKKEIRQKSTYKTEKKRSPQKSKHSQKNKKQKKQKKQKKAANVKTTQQTDNKKLDTKKLMLISGSLVILIVFLLFVSGVFDKGTPVTGVNQNFQSPPPSGPKIDLTNLDQINALEARVKTSPEDANLRLQLANLYYDSGLFTKAIEHYKKYLEKVPSNSDARIDLGVCYYNLSNFDEAISQIKIALKYSPKHQIGLLNLGIVNLSAGNTEEAKQWFKKAVDVNPNSASGQKAQELLNSHTN